MTMRRFLPASVLLSALILAMMAQPVGAGTVTSATGSFTLMRGPGVNRTFAFSVSQLPDGTVSGQAVLVLAFRGVIDHLQLNCLQVVGNEAIIGGVVTQSTDPSAVGANFAWAVEDNPDVSTLLFPASCTDLLATAEEPDLASLLSDFGIPLPNGSITIT